jgi:hypothetical protein
LSSSDCREFFGFQIDVASGTLFLLPCGVNLCRNHAITRIGELADPAEARLGDGGTRKRKHGD